MTDLEDLRSLARRIPQARRRMYENLPGYGTGGDGPSTGLGDRTLSLALRETMATDVAVRDLQHLDELEGLLRSLVTNHRPFHREMGQLKIIIDRWAPKPVWLESIAKKAGLGEPGCKSCHRYRFDDGRHGWGEIHRRGLCRTCIRVAARTAELYEWDDEMPHVGTVEWHHRTGKYITDDVIHQVMHGKKRRA